MGLVPKIEITTQAKDAITVKNITGSYHVTNNPGGFGAPNPVTGDVQGILLRWNPFTEDNAHSDTITYSALDAGYTKLAVFKDGIWKCRAFYQIIPGGAAPAVTWTLGDTRVLLTNADTILANEAITAVMITSLGTGVLLEIDRSKPITNTGFYVTSALNGTGTGNLWVGYEAAVHFKVQVAVDSCLVLKIGKDALRSFPEGCNCCSEVMDIHNRLYAAGVFFQQGNYQAAHEMLSGLYEFCNTNCNC